jgi:hypothetical protein
LELVQGLDFDTVHRNLNDLAKDDVAVDQYIWTRFALSQVFTSFADRGVTSDIDGGR